MGVRSLSQRKLLLGRKGCGGGTIGLHLAAVETGIPWSEGEMRDPHQVAFALHLGFALQVPKIGLIEPLAREAVRQRGGLCHLASLGFIPPFFIIYFLGHG